MYVCKAKQHVQISNLQLIFFTFFLLKDDWSSRAYQFVKFLVQSQLVLCISFWHLVHFRYLPKGFVIIMIWFLYERRFYMMLTQPISMIWLVALARIFTFTPGIKSVWYPAFLLSLSIVHYIGPKVLSVYTLCGCLVCLPSMTVYLS